MLSKQRRRQMVIKASPDQTATYTLAFAATAHLSYRGRRTENQDYVAQHLLSDGTLLCLLADGTGTYGSASSAYTVRYVADLYNRYQTYDPAQALRWSIEQTHTTLSQWLQQQPATGGCTLDAIAIRNGMLWFGHSGDSRIYLLRERQLYILTHDHSLPGQLAQQGLLHPDRVAQHDLRNALLRYIGSGRQPAADFGACQIVAGDSVVLCSDGLWGSLIPEDFVSHLYHNTPTAAAHSLTDLALRRGSSDNMSVLVLQLR
ncbi:serine/threonine-protein phosphatase [bacterium]|nr:serine/threonine-protein phosphatase [bacterium]